MEAVAMVETLWNEARELSLGNTINIDRVDSPPTPLEFYRNYVSTNKPCIISNATRHWAALANWSTNSYLANSIKSNSVSVHLTPHGRADSLVPRPGNTSDEKELCFASAHVERMPLSNALDLISSPAGTSRRNSMMVAYAQEQNDCFRSEYSDLGSDCELDIPWATEALGCLPDAVNLWIGNHFSQTSFHKDHYENLYAVVTGQKHFLLLPPTDVHRMYIRPYPAAQYSYSHQTGKFGLELETPERRVPWCSVNPYPSPENRDREIANFPLYFDGPKPFECTIKAGEILYLPSMWFHHVRQSPDSQGRTIAMNYWYDMQFDLKYAYFNLLKSIRLPAPSFVEETENKDSSSTVTESNVEDKFCTDVSLMSTRDADKDDQHD